MKRSLDFLIAALLLALLSPLLCIVGLLVRTQLGSPILFRQVRAGLHGQPFEIVKFRSMRNAVDAYGKPLPDDLRLTPLGRLLRATSIDELPELWNVLKGEMSLVGPRPLLMDYLPLYDETQRKRHDARPGVTGWAQVNGRNELSWDQKFRLDVWYVDNQSVWLDLKILFMTINYVFMRKGISASGTATMPLFKGNKQ